MNITTWIDYSTMQLIMRCNDCGDIVRVAADIATIMPRDLFTPENFNHTCGKKIDYNPEKQYDFKRVLPIWYLKLVPNLRQAAHYS